MIVWINGAFGSGKSTIADLLTKRLKPSYVYDPEQVGYFLWSVFPESMKRKGNFQHIPMWREFNYQILKYIYQQYDGVLIVPMTIYNRQYYEEIIGRLQADEIEVRHFILMAEKQTLIQRLVQRGESVDSWAAQHIDVCLQAFSSDIQHEKIDTERKSAEKVVSEIVNRLQITPTNNHREG